MAGYTRNDTSNNIATGNVINAADLDGEFDALVAAFHASTGHTHDGTAANGAPITKIGPVQDLVISTGAITPKTDNTVDLGSSSFEFKDLYIDGTANIDALVADTADINAGTIDGVVIGGSTTAAGSFTTLTTSSTVTLNGGTANGVLYLNGSKVATSGSALVFDGTNLGIGTSSPLVKFDVKVTTDTHVGIAATGIDEAFILAYDDAGVRTPNLNYAAASHKFLIASTEAMRLDSTGLGIGTSSPQSKLHIDVDGTALRISRGSSIGFLYNTGTASTDITRLQSNGGSVQLYTSGGTATLDASGNLGLGVTPSAWGGSYGVVENVGMGIWSINNANVDFIQNGFYNGTSYRYRNSAAASRYNQNAGVHSWFTAPSGTAGNAITFSQAMTLDASGNLGIGTTSPGSFVGTVKLVVGSAATTTTPGAITVYSGTATYGGLYFADGTVGDQLYRGAVEYNHSTDALLLYSAGTERARIDASGNLGLGVTPSAWTTFKALQISATGSVAAYSGQLTLGSNWYYNGADKYIIGDYATAYSQSIGQHRWYTAGVGTANANITFTQAMTLDASGNFYVGTTSQSGGSNITFSQPANADMKIAASVSTATRAAYQVFVNTTVTTVGTENSTGGSLASGTAAYATVLANSSAYPICFATNNTERARITSGGNLLVGETSGVERLVVSGTTSNYVIKSIAPSTSGTYYHILFDDAGTSHGSITSNGTNTAYNTTSDYRLKDNPQPLTGSGAFIDALKPKTWNWKANGSRGVGFIAHEVQEVSPGSVVGEKDGEQMQAMEYGSAEFIANIIAELQSLRQRVALLEGN